MNVKGGMSEYYREEYNDAPYSYDPEIYNQLVEGGFLVLKK
jgi:hypothetical protein